jgi:murein DD-endopeptidase MepM/ murein hydrolase activator NlpD
MKTINSACFFVLIIFSMVPPLSADRIVRKADPLDDSVIVNSLEMESRTIPEQDNLAESSGEIIFDDSFNQSVKKFESEKKVLKRKSSVISRLRAEDRRWHIKEYTIKPGDTVWGIARKFGTEPSLIIELNELNKSAQIRIGQMLMVPSKDGIYYTIKRGDTLTSISRKYGSEISEIAKLNNIDGSAIIAGKKIFIPGAVERMEPVAGKKVESDTENKKIDNSKKSRIARKNEKPTNRGIVLSWPLKGPVTSGFGYRKDPFSGIKSFHCGMDIGAEIGTPVKAAGNGRVVFSGWKGSYGYLVVIAHEKNYITVYAHNSKNLVKTGEIIKKGEVIALSGNTGAVTGAHLHFEIRKGTVPLNPGRLLKK